MSTFLTSFKEPIVVRFIPVEISTSETEKSFLNNSFTKWLPTNPELPVTNIFILFSIEPNFIYLPNLEISEL